MQAAVNSGVHIALTKRIDRLVSSRTNGMIRNLNVTADGIEILLTGQTGTYYNKQLATHAVLSLANADRYILTNDIEVI